MTDTPQDVERARRRGERLEGAPGERRSVTTMRRAAMGVRPRTSAMEAAIATCGAIGGFDIGLLPTDWGRLKEPTWAGYRANWHLRRARLAD
jgi:hypothetical protein